MAPRILTSAGDKIGIMACSQQASILAYFTVPPYLFSRALNLTRSMETRLMPDGRTYRRSILFSAAAAGS